MASKNQSGANGEATPRLYKSKIYKCDPCDRRSVPYGTDGVCPACRSPAPWADVELLRRAGVLDGE